MSQAREEGRAGKPGPLSGLKIVEMAGIGPVPLCGLMLSEMGAEVIRVERFQNPVQLLPTGPEYELDRHGRSILKLDLKRGEGLEVLKRLVANADMLIEGFRPGVMERLGLGPDEALALNPALVYGRMTGFGQEGPLAKSAGHDLTYIAYSGMLHAIGPKDGKPVPPLNLVGDFGGGTMFLLAGVLAALVERGRSGKGQVVDAAMVDGAAMLGVSFFGLLGSGFWTDRRGSNLLDGYSPFYDTYETGDGGHVAVACLEPQFFAEFAKLLPLEERFAKGQYDRGLWADMRTAITARFKEKTRDEWAALFEQTDACVAPVLSLGEAPGHHHARSRGGHEQVGPLTRPAPAPRFSRTPGEVSQPARPAADVLERFGLARQEAEQLAQDEIIG